MSADDIEIRRLAQADPDDPVLYRSIRLEALQANPEAFGSTFEVENEKPLSWFADRLGGSTVLGAFRNAQLVGVAFFAVQQDQKRAHKGGLWGMYVRPRARKAGVGRRLVEAICDLARQRVEQFSSQWWGTTSRHGGYTRDWALWSMAWRGTR
jgi:GNAT superfamily N-acetyltransferase